MRVLIVDPDNARAALVEEGLRETGQGGDIVTQHVSQLDMEQLSTFAPDAVVVACESPDRDMLEALRETGAGVDHSTPGIAAEVSLPTSLTVFRPVGSTPYWMLPPAALR